MSRYLKNSCAANYRIDQLTPQQHLDILDQYKDYLKAPDSKNSLTAVLCAALRYAVQCQKLDRVPSFTFYEQNQRDRIYTPEEQEAYFGVITDRRWRVFVNIMRFAGCRPEEIMTLRWEENFDWGNGILYIKKNPRKGFHGKSKNAVRALTICPEMYEAFEKMGIEREGWVFAATRKNSKNGRLAKRWPDDMHYATIKSAGILFDDPIKGKLVLYCWRHTFATDALENGMDIVTLSKALGHSRIEQSMRYVHISQDSIMRSMQEVQGRIRGNIQRRNIRLVKSTRNA